MNLSRVLSAALLVVLAALPNLRAEDPAAAAVAVLKLSKAVIPVTRAGGFMSFHNQYVAQIKQGGIDLIFTGDSITFQWRNVGKAVWDKYYAPMKAANFGHSGDGTQHLLWRLQHGECDGPAPKVVVLLIGTNNMGALYSVGDVIAGVTANVDELRKRWPTTRILLLAITPNGGSVPGQRLKLDAVNRGLAQLNDDRHVFFLDLGPKFMDEHGQVPVSLILGPHPTAAGYQVWATAMKEPLARLLGGENPAGQPLAE
jgi:lysophospholipase L1-like esterase